MTPFEFTTAQELRDHYKAVHNRMWNQPKPRKKPVRTDKQIERDFFRLAHAEFSGPHKHCEITYSFEQIIAALVRVTGIREYELVSQSREWRVSRARNCFYYLAQKLTNLSYSAIVQRVGRTDHTTGIHGVWRVQYGRKADQHMEIVGKVLAELGVAQ